MIFEGHIVFEPSAVRGRAAYSAVDTYTLTDAFCYQLLAVHINELIFKRGASGVDNKNFQKYCLQKKICLKQARY